MVPTRRIRLARKTAVAAAGSLWANRLQPRAWRELDLGLLALAIERHDLGWPRRVAQWVRGCDVLDVGCGRNLHGLGFLAVGARSYTGLDPTLDLDSSELKDSRLRWSRRVESGISLRELMSRQPRLRYAVADLATFTAAETGHFDTIVMHNVTEHLMEIEAEFARFASLLRPEGRIVFRHPNYYCWHGHHLRPRTVAEIDPDDPAQAAVLDWAHIRFDPAEHAWIGQNQNRIRLDDLRALVERHFVIECWDEDESPREQGIDRLTPEILTRYPEFTRRELATKCAFVVGRKRACD